MKCSPSFSSIFAKLNIFLLNFESRNEGNKPLVKCYTMRYNGFVLANQLYE